MITLVTGGSRSGKTRQALWSASSREPRVYLATAELLDDEMQQRATRHRRERGSEWRTIEEPYEVGGQLKNLRGVVVVDCLTLWLSNWMLKAEAEVESQIAQLRSSFLDTEADVIAITNEVGSSIVPENEVARKFRDYSGLMNQQIAEIADHVILMVCGVPLQVK